MQSSVSWRSMLLIDCQIAVRNMHVFRTIFGRNTHSFCPLLMRLLFSNGTAVADAADPGLTLRLSTVQLLQMLRRKEVQHELYQQEDARAQVQKLQSNEGLIASQVLRLTESLQLFASC